MIDKERIDRINSQYIIMMKNPADKLTPMTIARQMFPRDQKFFLDAHSHATYISHGYILIDLEQSTPKDCRVRCSILPGENRTVFRQTACYDKSGQA